MKEILDTIAKLKRFVINDYEFRNYYQMARQLKNLNGYHAYINDWFNHLKDSPSYIALLDKKYIDCSYVVINGNIVDLDSLWIDYQSDLRSFYGLNPKSL
jgi:hypothetical protein